MDEYFNAALHGFEGMRRSGPAWRYSIRFSQRPQFRFLFSVYYRVTYTANTNLL